MNDTRNSLYSRITALPVRSAVLICFGAQVLSPLTAFAEGRPSSAGTTSKRRFPEVTKHCNVVDTIQIQAFGRLMYKTTANRQ